MRKIHNMTWQYPNEVMHIVHDLLELVDGFEPPTC